MDQLLVHASDPSFSQENIINSLRKVAILPPQTLIQYGGVIPPHAAFVCPSPVAYPLLAQIWLRPCQTD